MCHAFGIPVLTKSRFGKNQSYKVLTPDRQYTLKEDHPLIIPVKLGEIPASSLLGDVVCSKLLTDVGQTNDMH